MVSVCSLRSKFLLTSETNTLNIGTAIETPMKVTVRLTVRKDKPYVTTPHFHTAPATASHNTANEEYYCTTGVAPGEFAHSFSHYCLTRCMSPDIRDATRAAVRNMIAFLGADHALPAIDAYMLCSVAGDLRLHEVVRIRPPSFRNSTALVVDAKMLLMDRSICRTTSCVSLPVFLRFLDV